MDTSNLTAEDIDNMFNEVHNQVQEEKKLSTKLVQFRNNVSNKAGYYSSKLFSEIVKNFERGWYSYLK